MCGRYVLLRPDIKELLKRLHLEDLYNLVVTESRYNIGPGQAVPALRSASTKERIEPVSLNWGMKAASFEAPGRTRFLINARSETITRRPTFRDSFKGRRCVLPASGFYEWNRGSPQAEPYLFRRADEAPFFLAGIWEQGPEGQDHCVVLTTAPNLLLSRIHDRMPVMLDADAAREWVEAPTGEKAAHLLQSYPAEQMTSRPVDPFVNNIRNEGEQCWADPKPQPTQPKKPEQLDLF